MASREIKRRLSLLEQQGVGQVRTVHLLADWLTDSERQAEMERLVRTGEASPDGVFIHHVIVDAAERPFASGTRP